MNSDVDVRASYLVFPSFIQPFLTWLTGKPLPGQKPLAILGPYFHFFCPLLMVLGGMLCILEVTHYLNSLWSWIVIILCWLTILSGARKLALTVRHQCVHYAFTGSKKLDIFFAEVATTLLCAQDAKTYQIDHAHLHHKINLLGGMKDPHVKVLYKYGFRPGMSKRSLWLHLMYCLISPSFHFQYTLQRIKYNFVLPNVTRKIASIVFWGFVTVLLVGHHITLLQFFIAYFIPIVILYNDSALLEIISEHPFCPIESNTEQNSSREIYVKKTWGIMCGSPLPSEHKTGLVKLALWMIWIIKMIGHFIVRATILCGDLSAHDLHHRKPSRYDWRISIYERQKEIDSGHPNWPPFRDVWGFRKALDQVFESYAIVKQPGESLKALSAI